MILNSNQIKTLNKILGHIILEDYSALPQFKDEASKIMALLAIGSGDKKFASKSTDAEPVNCSCEDDYDGPVVFEDFIIFGDSGINGIMDNSTEGVDISINKCLQGQFCITEYLPKDSVNLCKMFIKKDHILELARILEIITTYEPYMKATTESSDFISICKQLVLKFDTSRFVEKNKIEIHFGGGSSEYCIILTRDGELEINKMKNGNHEGAITLSNRKQIRLLSDFICFWTSQN